MNLDERENYNQGDQYFQNDNNQYREDDLDANPLDNSVMNDEEQRINQNLINQDEYDNNDSLDNVHGIDEENPIDDDEGPLENEDDFNDGDFDENDLEEEISYDDFEETDLDEENIDRDDFEENDFKEDDFDITEPKDPRIF